MFPFRRHKAATSNLAVAFALGTLGAVYAWQTLLVSWPLVVIYMMFVWKEYESARLLLKVLRSRRLARWALTAAEPILYAVLAATFAYPAYFAVLMIGALLFEALVFMLGFTNTEELASIQRKVKMNIVESLLALLAFVGAFFSYTQIALVFWGILITDITIYSVFFRNVYTVRAMPNPV